MLIGILVALAVASAKGVTVFALIQQVFFYIAPPISAVFLVGILWPRTTSIAATVTLILGFVVFLPAVVFVVFPNLSYLQPYDNFMHHTFAVFLLSLLTLVVVSFFTKPKTREELKGVIWTSSALGILEHEKGKYRGLRSLPMWWAAMVITIGTLYAYTHSRAGNTELLEAEALQYRIPPSSAVRVQARQELDDFNLWTGLGQILFSPSRRGERLTFQIPISEGGLYRIAAIVTRGPSYGAFRVEVNRQEAELSFLETELTPEGEFKVVERHTRVFDAIRRPSGSSTQVERVGIAGAHVVQRITLGDFQLEEGSHRLTFESVDPRNIGVDQFMITPLG
jgi:hypothetical protein